MDDKPHPDWPDNPAHKAAREVIDDLTGGRTLTKPARQAVRKALDDVDAPLTGRAKQDHAIGRAIGFHPR